MVSSILLQQSVNCFIYNYQLGKNLKNVFAPKKSNLMESCKRNKRIGGIKARTAEAAAAFDTIETATSPTAFPFFQTGSQQEDTPASKLELADPEFYKMGFVRSMRAYGVEFREGPNGFGVFASKDIEPSRRAKVVMEIPLELMLTISQTTPWMFFPDIIPVGHPIFDIINSTDPETDWDLRMACLLLYAFDHDKNFWQLYGDFLPSAEECTSLLLATEDDLKELHDENLASTMRKEKERVTEFWEKNWHPAMPLKVKRLARDPERFVWAVSMAQTRHINFRIRIGSLVQNANMFAPYADMMNHSCQPNCFFHWRFRDRMFVVMTNAGQRIKKGEEIVWYGAWIKRSNEDKELLHEVLLSALTNLQNMAVLLEHDFMAAYGGEAKDGPPAAKFSTGDTISFSSTHLLSNTKINEQDFVYSCFSVFRSHFLKMAGTISGVCLKCESCPIVVNFYVWKNLQSCYSFVLKNDQREVLQNYFGDAKVFMKYDVYKVVYVSADDVSSFQYFPPHKLLENHVSSEVLEDLK